MVDKFNFCLHNIDIATQKEIMSKIVFSFEGTVVSISREEIERSMSVPLGNSALNLNDTEQLEAIFDIACNHVSKEKQHELGMMSHSEFLKLFKIVE